MLSDVKEVHIKPGVLELASALNEVMSVLKNPTDAFKQINEKHMALQKDMAAHADILKKNQEVMSEHKANCVKESVARDAHKKDIDGKLATLADLDRTLKAKETSLKVRDTSLGSRDKALKEKESALAAKEDALAEKEAMLVKRELAVKEKDDELTKQLNSLQNKHEELKKVIG